MPIERKYSKFDKLTILATIIKCQFKSILVSLV